MRFVRYYILNIVLSFLMAYLIDKGHEEEARKFGQWCDVMMPKVKSGQLRFQFDAGKK